MAAETETTPVNEDNSFSDWHFVKAPKGTEITDLSDDDSIEILEREVEKPTTPFCSSGNMLISYISRFAQSRPNVKSALINVIINLQTRKSKPR